MHKKRLPGLILLLYKNSVGLRLRSRAKASSSENRINQDLSPASECDILFPKKENEVLLL
ncbi:hypothetical protein FAEPRAA2165_00176 [Faecalibacterium duncaniae]|uniref:Uncharacterized protein n=1 Tax=Faecalibacterium duncaniae (strain DSM 17677 / JCM 31915 / A2-165) TaxID=411483 RepID=C7H1N7_FAED2|nr:hypothetical protein FAEPRAA2165_00176 [Faecalibacterium duncaniae]